MWVSKEQWLALHRRINELESRMNQGCNGIYFQYEHAEEVPITSWSGLLTTRPYYRSISLQTLLEKMLQVMGLRVNYVVRPQSGFDLEPAKKERAGG